MKKAIFFSILILSVAASARSQPGAAQDTIYLKVQSYGDSIVLRWAPGSSFLWKTANKYGYKIERKALGERDYSPLVDNAVKPFTLGEWKARTDTTNVHVATAAQMLLGDFFLQPQDAATFSQKLTAAEEQQNRFALALFSAEFSTQAADGLAFRHVDRNIESGVKYYYRVSLFGAPEDYPVLPGTAYGEPDDAYEPKPVEDATAEGKDGRIEISWDKRTNNEHFSGFFVERSDDGGNNFYRITDIPIKSVRSGVYEDRYAFNDEVDQYYKPYHYRVIGVTSFADMGAYSNVVKAQSVDLTAPAPPSMLKAVSLGENEVELTWEDHLTAPPDHTGYFIGRSASVYGPFEKINRKPLKTSVRTYRDDNPVPHKPNFYVVIAADTAGNENQSVAAMAALKDYTPPAVPSGLTGVVDTIGIVSLTWDLGADEDLMGYRVYRANHPDAEFIQITSEPVPGNFYRDTIPLNTLTEHVYYKVAAFDFNYNPSDFSETLTLRRPDYVPPVKPVVRRFLAKPDTILLYFTPSSSADVVRHTIHRKKGEEDWKAVAHAGRGDSLYLDLAVEEFEKYAYAVEAFDEVGNASGKSFPVSVTAKASAKPAAANLSGEFDKVSRSFMLKWEYDFPGDYKFVIYRRNINGEFKTLGTAGKSARAFEDREFYRNEQGYEYAVKVVFDSGDESGLSEIVRAAFY